MARVAGELFAATTLQSASLKPTPKRSLTSPGRINTLGSLPAWMMVEQRSFAEGRKHSRNRSSTHSFNGSLGSTSREIYAAVKKTKRDSYQLAQFFSPDIISQVLQHPTAGKRLLQFCQSQACSENLEFLDQVIKYNDLLIHLAAMISLIHNTYIAPDSSSAINISYDLQKSATGNIETAIKSTIPGLQTLFLNTQRHVESLLAQDIYPRFVKQQVTIAASLALAEDRSRYEGLGDCFCLTDPSMPDNPIISASDGFVSVTGYSRNEIILRNCRFLQGLRTEQAVTSRMRESIVQGSESVELLLNYRKDGEAFWNLLYVTPLVDEHGAIKFFLGGQINCSATAQDHADIMRILSLGDEPNYDDTSQESSVDETRKTDFFKSIRKQSWKEEHFTIRSEPGMESELLDQNGKMDIGDQLEAFYTAYSKYIILKPDSFFTNLTISHFSTGIPNLLGLSSSTAPSALFHADIFTVLASHSASPSTFHSYRSTVLKSAQAGKAVSVELGLLTGAESKKLFKSARKELRYVSHWTPVKDLRGDTQFVVLIIAPK